MRVVVTGGAGYVGSHTCKELARQNHEVVVYDNLSTGHRELVRWGEFVHGDILDTQKLRQCLSRYKPDGIIHFAAHAYVGESVTDPGKYFRNNVYGSLSILEAMTAEKIAPLVASGTCAVYGQPDSMPISENTPASPINPYGASKLFMERMFADFANAHHTKWISLRYFNAAGCDFDMETGELHEPEPHLIPRVLMAIDGKIASLEVFGADYPTPDGTCIRDYVHVADLARAHVAALQFLLADGPSQAVNLGTGHGVSIMEIIRAAERVTEKKVPYSVSSRRKGDPAELVANPSRAEKVLGWRARHENIDTIVESAWNFYRKASSD